MFLQRLRHTTIVLYTLTLLVAPVLTAGQDWGHSSAEDLQIGAPADYPDAAAVVIFDKGLAITELRGLEFTRHIRMKILSLAAADEIFPVVVTCREYDHIGDIKAHILKPLGEVVKLDNDDIVERVSKEKQEREISFTLQGLEPDDILEYTYKISYYGGVDKLGAEKYFLFSQTIGYTWLENRENRLLEWDQDLYRHISNLPAWYFDGPLYTLRSEFTAKLGSDLDYSCFAVNIPEDKQEPYSRRGKGIIDRVYKYHTWVMEDVPPAQPEPFAPSTTNNRPALHFELFSTQGENRIIVGQFSNRHFEYVGRNMQGYINSYVKSTRGFTKKVRKMVDGLEDKHDQALHLYNWVKDEIGASQSRYELRPVQKSTKDLMKKKVGTPFEKNILLAQMLSAVEIDAWLFLIATRDAIDFRLSGRFNHMLVLASLPAGDMFLDASTERCSYGTLPPLCRVKTGLLIDYDDSELRTIYTGDPDSYRRDSIVVSIGADTDITCSHQIIFGGYPAMQYGDLYSTETEKAFADTVLSGMMTYRIGDAGLAAGWDSLSQFVVRTQYVLPDVATVDGSGVSLQVPHVWFAANPFEAENRQTSVDFVYPFSVEYQIVIESEQPLAFADSTHNLSFDMTGATYERNLTESNGRLGIHSILTLDQTKYPVDEYPAVRQFFGHVAESSGVVRLKKIM